MTPEYDYVIVGAGSSGCLIAERLSADPGTKVLLLEAGGEANTFLLRLPVGYYRTMFDPRTSRTFETEAEEGTAGRRIKWPRGRIVGGSSAINGLIWIRGDSRVYDRWGERGATGWSAEEATRLFRKVEAAPGPPSQRRGAHGMLKTSALRDRNPLAEAWMRAAESWGLPFTDDLAAEDGPAVGRSELSIHGRWRMSSARAFLGPARHRPNLDVMTGALARRVILENGRARGVEWLEGPATRKAHAAREVILCAGALQTPQLLQLSGLGPAETLRKAGIEVVADRPEIGGNLQDHYQMRLVLRMKDRRSLNLQMRDPLWMAKAALDWALFAKGPLTIGAGQIGAAARTKHAPGDWPDVQFMGMPFSTDSPGKPAHPFSGFTSVVWQCHPDSTGRIDVVSDDPRADPRIRPNYLATERDRATIVEGVRMLREFHARSPFADLLDAEVSPGPGVDSDADILDAVRRTASTVYHPCGTARMGSDEAAPVDPRLRVRGVEGLRVADASVMPEVPAANINAPTMMVAEKAAEMIRADAA
ncbi:MAG TPA: GMC family oxidoreductase N-terminal domain-containing protein [Paracoccaceae bacterium]|nr:GMC family oxidoreductase N-terminal domain-containing protein [Paracoccaceae bacterium]